MGTTSVRRSLFHHNFSRRPGTTAPNEPFQSTVTTTVPSHPPQTTTSEAPKPPITTSPLDNGEIVVKDKNGSYKMDIPVLSPVVGSEDGDEMEGVDGGRNSGSGADSTGETEISGREKEKIEASLVELMGRNRNRQMSSEPAEILNLIHQSLRNKVASLEEDKWMYEAEIDPQV